MMVRILFVAVLVTLISSDLQAGPRSRRLQSCSSGNCSSAPSSFSFESVSPVPAVSGAVDALAEVNAARSARGLRPYLRDDSLTQAALSAVRARAAGRIRGHLANDFSHLPAGSSAAAAGCGALEPSWGFRACAVYDNYTYAGAAMVMGADGLLYSHIFVR